MELRILLPPPIRLFGFAFFVVNELAARLLFPWRFVALTSWQERDSPAIIVFMRRIVHALDRIGSLGALAAAIAAPCCFPLFAAIAAGIGLGVIGKYETIVLYVFQAFALLAVVGLALGFREHRRFGPVALGTLSASALGYAFYRSWRIELLYIGLFGLLGGAVWNWLCLRRNKKSEPVLLSVITCPACGHQAEEAMPTNACLFFYDCPDCGATLKPKSGDCCVFCSYGSVPCPPIQLGSQCCA